MAAETHTDGSTFTLTVPLRMMDAQTGTEVTQSLKDVLESVLEAEDTGVVPVSKGESDGCRTYRWEAPSMVHKLSRGSTSVNGEKESSEAPQSSPSALTHILQVDHALSIVVPDYFVGDPNELPAEYVLRYPTLPLTDKPFSRSDLQAKERRPLDLTSQDLTFSGKSEPSTKVEKMASTLTEPWKAWRSMSGFFDKYMVGSLYGNQQYIPITEEVTFTLKHLPLADEAIEPNAPSGPGAVNRVD